MPLVFVHGVSNRDSPEWRENFLARDAFFRALVFPKLGLPKEAPIFNPYWGNAGVKFRWGNASLPESFESIETFGTEMEPEDLRIGAEVMSTAPPDAPDVVSIAKRSLLEAIDLVWSAALPAAQTPQAADALAESYQEAVVYAQKNPNPAWLSTAKSSNFLDLLLHHLKEAELSGVTSPETVEAEWESFGVGGLLDDLKEGLSRLTSVGNAGISSVVTALGRKKVHLGASMFVGDVFQYLTTRDDRANPGPIVKKVLGKFRTAEDTIKAEDSRLTIVGHSLGGVISYDILTHFAPDLEVDLLVTVGSQVALFEEMTLYKESRADFPVNPPTDKLPRPANVKRWVNVIDPNDIFSFRAEGVFEGVSDFKYETGFGLMEAHGGYFHRPSFYRRLGERLAQV